MGALSSNQFQPVLMSSFFLYNSILLLESGVLPGRSANNTADVQLNKESERHGKYPFAVVVICMYDRKVALCLIYLFNLI